MTKKHTNDSKGLEKRITFNKKGNQMVSFRPKHLSYHTHFTSLKVS